GRMLCPDARRHWPILCQTPSRERQTLHFPPRHPARLTVSTITRQPSRGGVTALLQDPGVAVQVGKVGEAGTVATLGVQSRAPSAGPCFDRVLVADRAEGDATRDQFLPSRREIRRDEIQAMHPAWRVGLDQLYGTGRSRGRELNDSEVGSGPVVDVEHEARLL